MNASRLRPVRAPIAIVTIVMALGGAACRTEPRVTANAIYKNGRIYTVNENNPWVEAVAIKDDGKFLRVGSNADVDKLIGASTEVIDLGGKVAMPGLYDLHVHPAYPYAYKIDGQLDFPATLTRAEIQSTLKAYAAASHPEKTWLRGKQWAHALFPPDGRMPKEFIDACGTARFCSWLRVATMSPSTARRSNLPGLPGAHRIPKVA